MKGKILLLTGVAVGYVLGARAGRERYEDIKKTASKLWNDPRVQKPVHQAQDFAKDKAPDVAEFVTDNVKNLVDKVVPSTKSTSRSSASRSSAKTSTTKPASTTK